MTPRGDTPRKPSLLRYAIMQMLVIERRYQARLKRSAFLHKVMHSYLFSLKPHPMARGTAIGLFWAAMPIPFQMLPATLFCLLGFANLPVAILCVWISNPFTYLPIFYVEYQVGALLFGSEAQLLVSFDEFSARYDHLLGTVGELYFIILKGALVIGVALSVAGYILGAMASRSLVTLAKKRRRRAHPR